MSVDLYPPRHHEGVSALATYLISAGVLNLDDPTASQWLAGLEHVPRHLFVPARAWAEPMDDRPEHLIDRNQEPAPWWDAVYSNTAIITQRNDGTAEVSDTSALPTSSLSCPHVAVEFLQLLAVADHHRILEIGTGTGWTAAMLAWRLRSWGGDGQVVTIEVDEHVADQAAANLAAAGAAPKLITGDGAVGSSANAPYDRVHVTCGVRDIPHPWVQQTRPGGVIVAPWMPPNGAWGEQLRLDVLDDQTAIGRFHGGAAFMMLRAQRRAQKWAPYADEHVTSTTRLDPRTPATSLEEGFSLYLAGAAPHLVITSTGWEQDPENGSWMWIMRLREQSGGAWAMATAVPDNPDVEIIQSGDRMLWDDLQAAYVGWIRASRPKRERFGLTVTPSGQHIWLDTPDHELT